MNFLVYIPGHDNCTVKHVGRGHFLRRFSTFGWWVDCSPAEDYICQLQARVAIIDALVERLLDIL